MYRVVSKHLVPLPSLPRSGFTAVAVAFWAAGCSQRENLPALRSLCAVYVTLLHNHTNANTRARARTRTPCPWRSAETNVCDPAQQKKKKKKKWAILLRSPPRCSWIRWSSSVSSAPLRALDAVVCFSSLLHINLILVSDLDELLMLPFSCPCHPYPYR